MNCCFYIIYFCQELLHLQNIKFAGMKIFRHLIFLLFLSKGFSVVAATGNNVETSYTLSVTRQFQPQPPRIDTIIIRFDYKQSALFHKYTLETLDSVIRILLRDTNITLSIDGFAYKDEGNDNICYYLSLNRALFIETYVLGRGVALTRINSIKAYGRTRQKYVNKDKNGLWVNCRAELRLVYPTPPKPKEFFDRDEDGLADDEDNCPDIFGYRDNGGCPDSGAIIIPFAIQEWALTPVTYNVMDSVVRMMRADPTITITIDGHAHLAEGAYSMCMRLAAERAEIVKNYLLSRQINKSRILEVKSFGISKPVNPAKNPKQILKNARAEIWLNGTPKSVPYQKPEIPFLK
jgi:outer membrane protein OmpA-like peptidoglycan-associated protein